MSDALMGSVWFAINLFLGFSAWRCVRQYFPQDSYFAMVIHTLVVYIGGLIAIGIILGALGLLTPFAHLGVAAVAGATYWISVWMVAPRNEIKAALKAPQPLPGERFWWAIWSVWVFLVVILIVAPCVITFPGDWDALWYHIPLVDHWCQTRNLYAPDAPSWFNPGNAELLSFWLVAPFSGDFLIGLTNLPALLLFATATVECAAAVGLLRPLAHLVGLIAVTQRVTELQLRGAGNDLLAVGLFLAALWYGLRHVASARRPPLLFCAICTGLLAGVKYYAPGYAGLATLVITLLVFERRGSRVALRVAGVLALGVLILAGYWYGRNALVTGSPLYPKGLLTSKDALSQRHPNVWGTTFWGNEDPKLLPLTSQAFYRMLGPIGWAAALLAPLSIGWLLVSGLRLGSSEGKIRVALAALLAGTAFLLAVTPLAVEDEPGTLNCLRWGYHPCRFGLCFFSLGVIALASILEAVYRAIVSPVRSARMYRYALVALVLVAVVLQLWHAARTMKPPSFEVALVIVNVLLLGIILVFIGTRLSSCARNYSFTAVFFLLAAAAGWSADILAKRWHSGFALHYDSLFATRVFSELARQDPATVRICVHDFRGYPYFGSRREFRVCQTIVTPDAEWLMDYFRSHHVTHVSVRKTSAAIIVGKGKYFWWFDRCLTDYPSCFHPFQEGKDFTVFQVDERCTEPVPTAVE